MHLVERTFPHQVYTGGEHNLAFSSGNGKIFAWGWNHNGQIGDGTNISRLFPVAVNVSGKTTVQISAGYLSNAVLTSDGSIYTWGDNGCAHVADLEMIQNPRPTITSASECLSGKNITHVSVGYAQTVAFSSDGSFFAWGSNDNEQDLIREVPRSVDFFRKNPWM